MTDEVAYPEIRIPPFRDRDDVSDATRARYLRLLAASVAGRVPESLVRAILARCMVTTKVGVRVELREWFAVDDSMGDMPPRARSIG